VTSPPERPTRDPEGVIPVVILNWNGEDDTVACLESIRKSGPAGFAPVIVDNGSDSESVERLKRECRRLYRKVLFLQQSGLSAGQWPPPATLAAHLDEDSLVFIQNAENLGFAMGSNVGVRLAERVGAEWVMLLNNDTVVAPDTFQELRTFLRSEPAAVAITPQIRYFGQRTRIQNCGGRLTYLGSRQYLFADMEASALARVSHSVVTFVTGCALLFKFRVTGALTEDFYFGEEDYEFALRMKKLGLEMACVHGAIVYHKGGASIRRRSSALGAILVSYVNRLVNTRNYYSRARWHTTRILAYLRLPILLRRNGIDPRQSIAIIRRTEAYLRGHRGVGRADHDAMVMSNS